MHSGNRDIEKVDDFSREVGEKLRVYRMPVDADVVGGRCGSLITGIFLLSESFVR